MQQISRLIFSTVLTGVIDSKRCSEPGMLYSAYATKIILQIDKVTYTYWFCLWRFRVHIYCWKCMVSSRVLGLASNPFFAISTRGYLWRALFFDSHDLLLYI